MARVDTPNPLLAAPAAGRLRGEHARRGAHAFVDRLAPVFPNESPPGAGGFAGPAPPPGGPGAGRGAPNTEGPLFFGCFFLGKQKKVSGPPGRTPRLPPSAKA